MSTRCSIDAVATREVLDLLQRVAADPTGDRAIGITGPGGCGKSTVLAAVATSYRSARVPVHGLSALRSRSPTDGVLVIDDAQLLTPADLALVRERVDAAGTRLLIAFRPWPRSRELGHLATALRRTGHLVVVGHLDRASTERRAAAVLEEPPTSDAVDVLWAQTAGHPTLLETVLDTWRGTWGTGGPIDPTASAELLDALQPLAADLDPAPRALIHALAAGADLDDDVLPGLLGIDAETVRTVAEEARSTGYLLQDGRVIPLVAHVVMATTPPARTRAIRTALLRIRHRLGRDVTDLARELTCEGIRDGLVAEVLRSAGDRHRVTEPELAARCYADAVSAGDTTSALTVRRAECAARSGDFETALQLVDHVLGDSASPDHGVAIDVAATIMAHRGLLGRAAELYRWLGRDRAGAVTAGAGPAMEAMAMLAVGAREEASDALAVAHAHRSPTMAAGATLLMTEGIWESVVGHGPNAMAALSRATTLFECADPAALVSDTPAAVTALVAIQTGDLDVAESALRRAVDRDLGGSLTRRRHHLLLAWVAMLRSQFALARDLLATAAESGPVDVSARDEFFVHALHLGLARRTSDAPGLVRAWADAREVLLRHPTDLFVLLPLGEFTVAAARLGESARVAGHLAEAWKVLGGLGDPVIWSTTLHWSCVQAAVLTNRPADVEPHAIALVAAARHSTFAAALAAAGRVWMEVLAGTIDVDRTQAAAQRLRTFGLAWEGSRLLGQAAAHSTDRRTIATLLQAARGLQEPAEMVRSHDSTDQPSRASRPTPALLSAREREVAELLLQQQTYREIGERLFISPKTVEHHVARMKQRVGVVDRTEFLTQLRVIAGAVNGASN